MQKTLLAEKKIFRKLETVLLMGFQTINKTLTGN